MDNDVLLSIIVTVYNKAEYIAQCLKSILNQGDKNFQLIVIDDGSSDSSLEIIYNMLSGNEKYTIFEKKHTGVSDTRNIGLSLVKTKYFMFIDGDDELTSDAVFKLNNMLRNENYDLLVFGITHIMPDGSKITDLKHRSMSLDNSDLRHNMTKLWDAGIMCSSCNKVFNKELIAANNVRFPDIDFGEDLYFVCDYLKSCRSIYTFNDCFYLYRQHRKDSLSKKIRNDFFEIRKKEHFYLADYFEKNQFFGTDTEEFLARRFVDRAIGCIENEVSAFNKNKLRNKYRNIKKIVFDDEIYKCIKIAHYDSLKMKLLIFPIKHQVPCLSFIVGLGLSAVRNGFPRLFNRLKKNRS